MVALHSFKLTGISLLLSTTGAFARPSRFSGQHIKDARQLRASYDYIVVGGGTSGLTVADRLTEDSAVTVLVLEAGELDQGESFFKLPTLAGGAVGTKYDWNITAEPNAALNNRAVPLPQGKVVGGGSMLNRMVFDRGSKADYDAWKDLGNEGWAFADLLPYFKKSETFTNPEPSIAEFNITADASAHGTSGPIQSTFGRFIWPTTKNFLAAVTGLGISEVDGYNGDASGVFWVTTSKDHVTALRSPAKEHLALAEGRSNFHLVTSTQVSKLLFASSDSTTNSTAQVTGVELENDATCGTTTLYADKEVILAAGALHTPQILLLSGIGDATALAALGQEVIADVPGVGHNFQDHQFVTLVLSLPNSPLSPGNLTANATFAAEASAEFNATGSGPDSTTNAAIFAFLPLSQYATNSSAILSSITSSNGSLADGTPATVTAGYAAQRKLLDDLLASPDAASMEFLYGDPAIVVALVKPLSRGAVTIKSLNITDAPIVDWRAVSDSSDFEMLKAGVTFARTIAATPSFTSLGASEIVPGTAVDADTFIRGNLATIYHPVGTCSMMPLELGGVVSSELKVYGVEGLRVVDASIMPLVPATHTQSTVYAVAEKAADLIKGISSV